MLTVLHVMTADPLPGRSAHLFRPYLNANPLEDKSGGSASNPNRPFTWPDAQALLHAHRAVRQAAMARGSLTAYSDRSGVHPKSVNGSFTTRDFFAMLGVPFVAGWTPRAGTSCVTSRPRTS
ncbi:MAG TPA: hypothetical protein VFW60_09115 [Rhodanobacteraceae bacterium]|nr:hypothetical protein [Rhodanobacteraceae bacterium]